MTRQEKIESRVKELEGQLCRAREVLDGPGAERHRVDASLFDGGFNAGVRSCREWLKKVFYPTPSPCPHESRVKELEEAIEEHCHRWETWANAYPEDIFEPLTKEEIKQYSNIITRNSAAMGRHILKNVKEDTAELRRRAGIREE